MESLVDNIKIYIEDKIELLKLNLEQAIAKRLSSVIFYGLAVVFGAFFLLFLNITLALAISEALNNTILGFLIISLVYLVLLVILLLFKDNLPIDKKAEDIASNIFEKNK